MAQSPHDIMISGIPNEDNAEVYLWDIFTPIERELNVYVEWLSVHPVRVQNKRQPKTTYGFLRFEDPTVHPEVVCRVDGVSHRG